MAKSYSLKKQIPREVTLVLAEELVRALPDIVIVGSLRRGCEIVGDVDLLNDLTYRDGPPADPSR